MAAGGNNRSRLLLVILLVTSLFLITLDLRGVSITKNSRSATQSLLAPVQRGVSDFFSPVGNFFSDIKNFGKTKAELKDLKSENAKLRKKVIFNKDTNGQLNKLKGVLDLAGRGGYKVVSARVIGKGSSSTFSQTITIDAGTNDGVKKDMTVMGELGLVGVVKSATSTSAIVLLMNDPTFRIGVRIARSQSVGVLMGEGDNTYTLQLLDPSGSIEVNDVLLSLGSDNNRPFVPGLPVGYVKSVKNTSATLTQEASVKSYSNLGSLGVVSVIIRVPNGGPKDALIPQPIPTPTTTIYVTQSPTPEATN
ncbi:MAG: cell shape-determining protein [Actinobacteria bacterium]|uniref:Cell shape-determining protein MreC n=1 Tax=freshwater metagenome TaxID=449393 RepID=A0A6J6N8S9_9ZZZZ|nr:cell shape-determining protein [Actinomycetota bacterium]MSW22810.1 cell shape-determining protein [Actinomycetota bacterium]MSX04262.1 cell shape-determining protein [Actinomycetota bacterium]MSX84186.1 cell shape-determining protein [Actinomycetota bacterium]MSY96998.1 cell shape-determining protein [Actinomycetota bacterium]